MVSLLSQRRPHWTLLALFSLPDDCIDMFSVRSKQLVVAQEVINYLYEDIAGVSESTALNATFFSLLKADKSINKRFNIKYTLKHSLLLFGIIDTAVKYPIAPFCDNAGLLCYIISTQIKPDAVLPSHQQRSS